MKSVHILLIIITYLLNSGCNNPSKHRFVLKGEIIGQDTGTFILRTVHNQTAVYDTTELNKGEFIFEGTISEPMIASLNTGDKLNQIELFLEPGIMKITLQKNDLKVFQMVGSKTQKEASQFKKLTLPFEESRSILNLERRKVFDSIQNSRNEKHVSQWNKDYDSLTYLMDSIKVLIDSISLDYILKHPKSYVSPYYLFYLSGDESCPYDLSKSVFEKLDPSIQNSKYGKMIREDLRKMGNTQVGVVAPDFKAIDLMDRTITLSQFKGQKVILLEFWASWCIPCRESLPDLKLLYDKFNSEGLEIICVSIDYDKNSWEKAVAEEQIGTLFNIWVAQNFSGGPTQITENDIYSNYNYNTIPQTILIDKKGTIAAIWIGASEENKDSLDKQLSKLLN